MILGSTVAGVPSLFIGLYLLWKRYGPRVDFKASARILFASTIAAFMTYLLLSMWNAADWIRLATGLVIFLAVYLTATPLVGAISQPDIWTLRAMFSETGMISRIINIPLRIMETLLHIRDRRVKCARVES